MTKKPFYDLANEEMQRLITCYLELAEKSKAFSNLAAEHIMDEDCRRIVLAGIGSGFIPESTSAKQVVEEWARTKAIPFDIETSITAGVYHHIRPYGRQFIDEIQTETRDFSYFTPEYISEHPYLLPIFQHLAGFFSKATLRNKVGNASDRSIPISVAKKLADVLNERGLKGNVNKGEILQRLESTLEGLVRDLVGKVLLENVVANALIERSLPFQREKEYRTLKGVVYDFRADFVLPCASEPAAFIEVRKSSTRHASLYAKDKMFSAINWKGNNQNLLGVLLIDGPWTSNTLTTIAKVFDYVIPIANVHEVAEVLEAYLSGDRSKLRWLIEFRISPAT
jgi:hypothetical protein